MGTFKLCSCGGVASWNSYFGKFICAKCGGVVEKMYKVLVIVDAQNDFITGALGSQEADAAVPNIVKLIKENKWDSIVCTMDTHDDNYFNTLEGHKLPVKHCIKESTGWCLDSRILTALNNKFNYYEKETFGSLDLANEMYLDLIYKPEHEIHVCGFCTDICVMANATILRAMFPNTRIIVHKNACAGVTPESHEAALIIFNAQQIDVED